jgi:hypothetical protein
MSIRNDIVDKDGNVIGHEIQNGSGDGKFGRQPDPHDPSWKGVDPDGLLPPLGPPPLGPPDPNQLTIVSPGQLTAEDKRVMKLFGAEPLYSLQGQAVSKAAFELAQQLQSSRSVQDPNDLVGGSLRAAGLPARPTLDPHDRGYTPCSRTEVLVVAGILLALFLAALLFMFYFAPDPAGKPFQGRPDFPNHAPVAPPIPR